MVWLESVIRKCIKKKKKKKKISWILEWVRMSAEYVGNLKDKKILRFITIEFYDMQENECKTFIH